MRLPARFTVAHDFQSGNDPPLTISAGMSGTFYKYDKDGGVAIRLDAHLGRHFVLLDDVKWIVIGDV